MKLQIVLISSFILLLLSCKTETAINYQSKDVVWKDIDSLTNHSTNYTLFNMDSSWESRIKRPVDSNFIKENIKVIDNSIPIGQFLNEQGWKYEFFLVDTLKFEGFGEFILLFGKYLYTPDPVFLDQRKLLLIKISDNVAVASFHLAQTKENYMIDAVKTSIILPGFKIISRTVTHWCSDNIIDDYLYCTWSNDTEFKTYDCQVERFIPYQKAITKRTEYKTKIN